MHTLELVLPYKYVIKGLGGQPSTPSFPEAAFPPSSLERLAATSAPDHTLSAPFSQAILGY